MFATIVSTILGFVATKGGTAAAKVAAKLIPYQVYLTPALVMAGCGAAFYLTHKTDTLGLILAGFFAANEAILAAQMQSLPSK